MGQISGAGVSVGCFPQLRYRHTVETDPEQFPKNPTLKATALGTVLSVRGENTPPGFLQRYIFPLTQKRVQKNEAVLMDLEMTPVKVTRPGSKFPILLGYSPPPSAEMPVIIFTPGSANRLKAYFSFCQEMKNKGFGLLLYQRALKDENHHHFARQKLSHQKLEQKCEEDLLFLTKALAEGTLELGNGETPKIPYENQQLWGYSAGGITTANFIKKHPERPYHSVVLISPPLSFKEALDNIKKTEVPWPLRHFMSTSNIQAAMGDAFTLPDLNSALPYPVYVFNGSQDGLTQHGPKHWVERQQQPKEGDETTSGKNTIRYIEIPEATHGSIIDHPAEEPSTQKGWGLFKTASTSSSTDPLYQQLIKKFLATQNETRTSTPSDATTVPSFDTDDGSLSGASERLKTPKSFDMKG